MAAQYEQNIRKEPRGSSRVSHLCEEIAASVLQTKWENADQIRLQLGCNSSSHGLLGAPRLAIGGIKFQRVLAATFALQWQAVDANAGGKFGTGGQSGALNTLYQIGGHRSIQLALELFP